VIRDRVVRVSVSRLERSGGRLSPGPAYLLASERTDARGRFCVKGWRPKTAGSYEVTASIAQRGPGVLHDSTCPARVSVSSAR